MKRVSLSLLLTFLSAALHAQSAIEPPIADQFDVVTLDWVEKSGTLKTYDGMSAFCRNPQVRKSVQQTLHSIHQYDSLIMSKMEDTSEYIAWDKKEGKKTLSDVEQMEEDYGMKLFDDHMREVCVFRREIEANKENLKNGMGVESYDAKILVLEQSQVRYFNRIDKLVLKINEHLHVLDIDR